jgi:hypothetical protein
MADEKQGASFNPDDASGLLDNARVTVTAVKVDFFTAKSGAKFVNVDVTYKGAGQEITEHYMLGGADQWAPNATKTGAIPVTEGGRVWNKSDVFKLVKSFIDAGAPKPGNDLSVFVGLDVHVNRVTQEGATYVDKDGKERQRTTLLVTKLYGKAEVAKVAGKAKAAVAVSDAPVADDSNDAYIMELLVEIVTEAGGSIAKDKLPQPAFIKLTRAKKASIRQAVQDRLANDAYLGTLVEAGLIAFDGKTITLAA